MLRHALFTTAPAALALLVMAGAIVRIHVEERFLRAQYAGYAAYAKSIWRMVPLVD